MSNEVDSELTQQPDQAPATGELNLDELTKKLAQDLEEAQKKASENWDLFLRTRADADNVRRRAQKEVEDAGKYAIEKFARELLAVVDSLEHGLAVEGDIGDKGVREGLVLTHKLLISTLEKFGIIAINPLGLTFDPSRHEALSTQFNNEVEPNKVLTVVQKGFTLQDRLLRPARVIVSRATE